MAKARDAFRTISEVAEWLDTPAHVLRFWESKFTQVKPVKRAGGRRYYRPDDMALLGGIKTLLHEDGMTIKGVQKLLREKGVKHVAALGPSPEGYDDDTEEVLDAAPTPPEAETVVSLSVRPAPGTAPEPAPEPTPEPAGDTPPLVAEAGDLGGAGMQMSFGGFGGADEAPGSAAPDPSLPADIDEDAIDPGPGPAGRLAALDRDRIAERAGQLAPLAARLGALAERLPRP